jgi:catechol 2,3-dioxygenase-like lactoylglutathione lyase family enzyme
MQVRHVGIVCRDIEESIQFYCNFLECTISRRMNESGTFISAILGVQDTQVQTVKLSLPDGTAEIELLHFSNPLSDNQTTLFSYGLTHIALKVKNIDNLHNKMVKANLQIISKPEFSDDGCAKVFFCQDPNGVFLELVELHQKL